MELLGYNYRMNEMQAALGLSQLKKLNSFIKRKDKLLIYIIVSYHQSKIL